MSTETQVASTSEIAMRRARNRRWLMRGLLAVLVIAAVTWVLWYVLEGRWYESTDDAYVKGNVVQITPRIGGTVVSIGAEGGDLVHAGQELVKLDPSTAEVALSAAEAELARTVRHVLGMYNDVSRAQDEVAARRVALEKARADFQRRQGLAATGAISTEELAHARDALNAAESMLSSAQQNLATSKVLVSDHLVAANPDVRAAAAKLRQAYLDDAHTELVAPVGGYVAKRTVQVGQHVPPGQPLMAVIPLDQVWINANFKETQLRHMRIGQAVTLTSDLYGGDVVFHGLVASLGVGTGSAFSLLPAQNATGNWIKIVQRVPVRIALTRPEELKAHPLRIGLSMAVSVNLHDRRGPLLSTQSPSQPLFTTDVYRSQLNAADALVKRIIHDNVSAARKH